MRYLKLSPEQRSHKQWVARRNHLVCELLEIDKSLTSYEALALANKALTNKKKLKPKKQKPAHSPVLLETYDLCGWFDGSCAPVNPGGMGGWGLIIKNHQGEDLAALKGQLHDGPTMSVNVAEYHGCANLLELIGSLAGNGWSALVRGDSKLVIQQMLGNWRIKGGLYIDECRRAQRALQRLESMGVLVHFAWVPREENQETDDLSKGIV